MEPSWIKSLLALVLFFTLACYQVVDAEDVECADLRCFPETNVTVLAAWCDPGHFHVSANIMGGTVTVSGGGLPVNLKCPVVPVECPDQLESSLLGPR